MKKWVSAPAYCQTSSGLNEDYFTLRWGGARILALEDTAT